MDVLLSIAPIAAMIVLMTKRDGWPAHVALPFTAVLVYAVKTVYFAADANLVNATVVNGFLNALVPILIIAGAIFLFKTMEATGGMGVIRTWLNGITDDRVAQLMIVGWAFAFMIEGASGFGTPAALAAPLLVGMGFEPLKVAIFCLVMNSVPVSFGAVGTPLWFGLGQLSLDDADLLAIGYRAARIHAVAALPVVLVGLRTILPWSALRPSLGFVALSTGACVGPYVALASVNYEFPALVGGMLGLAITVGLAKAGVGLAKTGAPGPGEPPSFRALLKATFPLWGTVLILVVTRIPQLGIKRLLVGTSPSTRIDLGSLADVEVSRSLVIVVENIFDAETRWTFQTLYIPAIIPFLVISLLTFALARLGGGQLRRTAVETYRRMIQPSVALFGALAVVQLMMVGGESAMVILIGEFFADLTGTAWPYFAAYLGALGSFFSGSATISNLTFGGIQQSIAHRLELDPTGILSVQVVGAAMGNMVCLNNIVAVCSILGISAQEGHILKRTAVPMLVYGTVAALLSTVG